MSAIALNREGRRTVKRLFDYSYKQVKANIDKVRSEDTAEAWGMVRAFEAYEKSAGTLEDKEAYLRAILGKAWVIPGQGPLL